MTINYNVVANDARVNITVVADGKMYVADSDSHPNIREIVQAATAGDPNVVNLFNVAGAIERSFERLSERVTVADDQIFLDGDPAPAALSDAILRHYRTGADFESLVNFLEKLANNPNPDSVEQLYAWLEATGGFTITDDGDLVAYKGVEEQDGKFYSISHGKAIVDGTEVSGRIPNALGSVIEMPRSEVQFNPLVGCSTGLHAGVWDYAESFGRGHVLEVLIDPRDVVSVPHDCDAQKLRVCRYTVLDVIDAPHSTPVRGFEYADYDDVDEWWGELDDEGYDPDPDYHDDQDEDGFAVGDTVRIVDDESGQYPNVVGVTGEIVAFTDDEHYKYLVASDNYPGNLFCSADELVLV